MPSIYPVAKENSDRERETYLLDSVSSATCIRKMYEIVASDPDDGENFMALEWLDTTLAQLKYRTQPKSHALI